MSRSPTPEQIEVIKHRGSPLRIVAGPGTGKTSCLTERIVDLILNDKTEPKRITAITFTRAAAGEILKKLEERKVRTDKIPNVGTVHSKAVRLLRKHSAKLGIDAKFNLFSEMEMGLLTKDVGADLSSLGIKLPFRGSGAIYGYLRAYRADRSGAGVPSWISENQRNQSHYVAFSEAFDRIQRYYNGIDWFQVVHLANDLLDSFPDVASEERTAIDHLLVDEYQDLNRREQEFIKRLAGKPEGFCVFGDEDQSIYESQRFADPDGLIHLHKAMTGLVTKPLSYCHRCPPKVLEKANQLIAKNARRISDKPPLQAHDPNKQGIVVTIPRRSKKAEIDWVAEKILQLHEKGFEFKDFLLLFSEGKIATDYIERLKEVGVPIKVQLKTAGPFDSECFSFVFSTLRLICNKENNLAVRQCLEYWPGIGAETIRDLRALSTQASTPLWGTVKQIAENPSTYGGLRRRKAIAGFYGAMEQVAAVTEYDQVIPAILKNLPECGNDPGARILADYFSNQKGKEEALKIVEAVEGFEQERDMGRYEVADPSEDKARIMTMHSSKGLQAKVVIIPALEDDLIPGQAPNIEEKRRLFFVSITRSEKILLMSWASQRVGSEIHRMGGRMLGKIKSRFLSDMGE